jgi:DNA-binding NarL/FixJ family response regulator
MNVLISSQSNFVRNNFISSLIPYGIVLSHSEHMDEVPEKLITQSFDIVILDAIHEDFQPIFQIMKLIKGHPEEKVRKVAILLLIGGIDRQNITMAVQSGAIGFIKSNATDEVIVKYIMEIYQKVRGVPPERKFVRLSLDITDPNERIGVKFRSPVNSQLIMGLIKDISFGGIAVELVGTFPPDSIAPSLEIKNLLFIIDGKDVSVDAAVVAYKQNFCAFRFLDMPAQERDTISQFIFARMTMEQKKIEKAAEDARKAAEAEKEKELASKDPKADISEAAAEKKE